MSLITACLFASSFGWAETAIVIHPENQNTLSIEDIKRIFLGKKKSYPDGTKAIPIDQKEGSAPRTAFTFVILNKSDQQMRAYWAQQLFTGKGTPPKDFRNNTDVKKLVSTNPSLIGYIDSKAVDDSVKVIHTF
ncbi:MAG: phosphate ABC transporter substrate-binding protein [Cellvibrionaceae bacterium]